MGLGASVVAAVETDEKSFVVRAVSGERGSARVVQRVSSGARG